tara:strand:- start:2684 stop:2857 length:174 start_codon:yes stop_codon:yes gene_type:complete
MLRSHFKTNYFLIEKYALYIVEKCGVIPSRFNQVLIDAIDKTILSVSRAMKIVNNTS